MAQTQYEDVAVPNGGHVSVDVHSRFTPQAAASQSRTQIGIVIVGHVDHGKSTLVGRLLHDTGSMAEGKFEQIAAVCKKRGMPFEWSFLLDALQAERDQNVTIDTTQIWFRTARRDYVIIDAPGHREFLKNMVTGAAASDAALLLVDGEEGVKEQTKRHAYLLHLLGVKQIVVLINKMDRLGYAKCRFEEVAAEVGAYLQEIGSIAPMAVIPISARAGDMLLHRGPHLPWYDGPTVVDALDSFVPRPSPTGQPLRLPVQDIYRFDERRIIVGRIESGTLKAGDTILLSPANQTVKVQRIESWPPSHTAEAGAGESVGVTLAEQLFVERGTLISHVEDAPILTNVLHARLFWLGHDPLLPGKRYRLRLATAEFQAELKRIEFVIDTDSLAAAEAGEVRHNQVAEVVFHIRGLAAVDDFAMLPTTGRFVVIEDYDIVGGGIISTAGLHDQRVAPTRVTSGNLSTVDLQISPQDRARANGHSGGILWFTGLSGSGKSTLALGLQQRLFAKGYQVFVLDGDNVRQGLCADLGFAPRDRAENIRRVGEVAGLFARAGMIVITAFISPYREDRSRARACVPEYFHSVYIQADVTTCEKRDVKGLYQKARRGEIKEFTGVSAPYEAPEDAELIVNTMTHSVDECVAQLVEYAERQFVKGALAVNNSEVH